MIRTIVEQDYSEVKSLLEELSPSDASPSDVKLRADINRINGQPNMELIGYDVEGKIAGMCTLGRVEGLSKGGRPFAVIENLVVASAFRSKGIGKALVRFAIETARMWGCYKAILETGTRQEWKLGFYEKCGLEKGEKIAFIKRFT